MRKLLKKIVARLGLRKKRAELEKLFALGLPRELRPALEYLLTGACDEETAKVVAVAESRRAQIASFGQKTVPIWYSPKPGSAGTDVNSTADPQPGKVLTFTMEKVSRTGKDRKWGTVLYLLGRGFGCERGFELGACAGISALYLSSVPSMNEFITVEGSNGLAEIARESLRSRPNARVLNQLFDEAINEQSPELGGKIDCAFIDGHHEKVATIHYFNKMLPLLKRGGLVIFDDVSWSHDMREAWKLLSARNEFSHTIDLGAIGLGVLTETSAHNHTGPRQWNLQPLTGRHAIGDPEGWKEA